MWVIDRIPNDAERLPTLDILARHIEACDWFKGMKVRGSIKDVFPTTPRTLNYNVFITALFNPSHRKFIHSLTPYLT
jgi:hypothetical protein